ncbi:MAG TPA: hypothetical protein VK484_02205 [Ferruginibacter sp.]|nr:hypothetical protein [Ferruginibacter sp.]
MRLCIFFSFCNNYDKWKIAENFKTVKVSPDGKSIIWGDPEYGKGGMHECVDDLYYLWGDWVIRHKL